MGVGEAVGVVGSRADADFWCVAHQLLVVRAFGALAYPDAGEDLGQAAVDTDVDERRAGRVVFFSADRDGGCVAMGMVVEGTTGDTAFCNMCTHGKNPFWVRPHGRDAPCVHGRPDRWNRKDPVG